MKRLASSLVLVMACASQPEVRDPRAVSDPISLLPEKRRVLYWKRGCDDPAEEVAEVLQQEEPITILWRAECADGRVLRCSHRRVMKCRWEKGTKTGTAAR